jgi:hypothetical protein
MLLNTTGITVKLFINGLKVNLTAVVIPKYWQIKQNLEINVT